MPKNIFSRYDHEGPSYMHEALFKFGPSAIQYHKKVEKKGSKLGPSAIQYHKRYKFEQ